MKTFFFLGDHPKKSHITYMKIFFLVHLKNFSNTTRRAFLTAFQFSLLDLYLKIVIILCSAVIFYFSSMT